MPVPAQVIEDKEELIKLIASNQGVDMEQVKALMELLQKGQQLGFPPARRTPIPPVKRRRVIVGERDELDPRTIRLGRPR